MNTLTRFDAALDYGGPVNARLVLVALVAAAAGGSCADVNVLALAKRLRLPEATVYWHVRRLLRDGVLHRFPPAYGPDDGNCWAFDARMDLEART